MRVLKSVFLYFSCLCVVVSSSLVFGQNPQLVSMNDQIALDTLVNKELYPQLDFFFEKLLKEKKDIVIDGTKAFNGRDKFLPGKIALAFSYLLVNTPTNSPKFKHYLDGYRQIADMTIDEANESWGIYYYMSALNKLRKAGILNDAISKRTLERLNARLDWRTFIRPNYTTSLPTNYFGVAFSIARLRYVLGWEDATGSETLLKKMVDHYSKYSGKFGFSDETEGEGRFDRYSFVFIGEICQRFIETDMKPTPELKKWLRNSANVMILQFNSRGEGINYGRSISAYGDTAFLELLSAAAYCDVLTPQEKEMAYAFSTRATKRYTQFWYDKQTRSVNLWDKGRRTDAYRGKYRILGENFSLLHQYIYTNDIWNRAGFKGKKPTAEFDSWIQKLPAFTLTRFACGEFDRALATFRDNGRIINIPLINGGKEQHAFSPYYPIPYSHGLIRGLADAPVPILIPQFTMSDGSKLLPVGYIQKIETKKAGDSVTVTYSNSGMDKIGRFNPEFDKRITSKTEYVVRSGVITRKDMYIPSGKMDIEEIRLELPVFSEKGKVAGNKVVFEKGDLYEVEVTGIDDCTLDDVSSQALYSAPEGQLKSRVQYSSKKKSFDKPFVITWTIKYR